MPAVTYLSDHEIKAWASVPDDKDCDEILQELRTLTGENWLISVREIAELQSTWAALLRRKAKRYKAYTLYADCHGEWQVINLNTPRGGSNFYHSPQSRSDVINYMLGYIGGWHRRQNKADREQPTQELATIHHPEVIADLVKNWIDRGEKPENVRDALRDRMIETYKDVAPQAVFGKRKKRADERLLDGS